MENIYIQSGRSKVENDIDPNTNSSHILLITYFHHNIVVGFVIQI